MENLGGPAETFLKFFVCKKIFCLAIILTSHLNTPLVAEAALLRMMWVGEEWANT